MRFAGLLIVTLCSLAALVPSAAHAQCSPPTGFTAISTVAELRAIGQGSYFLCNDLDLAGAAFEPLFPRKSLPFNGILDGNGKTIRGFKYIYPADPATRIGLNYDGIGLFGVIGPLGQVRNLTLRDVEVTAQPILVPAGLPRPAGPWTTGRVAALAGINQGSISAVIVMGPKIGATGIAGGLVGENIGQAPGPGLGGISNSHVHDPQITGLSGGLQNVRSVNLAGLAGTNTGTIYNSSAQRVSVTGDSYLGGLVGSNSRDSGKLGTISDSWATGKVVVPALSFSSWRAGGLVGFNFQGRIIRSYTHNCSVNISAGTIFESAGGLIGEHYRGSENSLDPQIAECSANCTIDAPTTTFAGGLAGKVADYVRSGDTIVNSIALGAVQGGKSAAGGLAGQLLGKVSTSLSLATVRPPSTNTLAGGVAGQVQPGTLITGTYYLKDANPALADPRGEGRSAAALNTLGTFSGWSISPWPARTASLWKLPLAEAAPFPHLRWKGIVDAVSEYYAAYRAGLAAEVAAVQETSGTSQVVVWNGGAAGFEKHILSRNAGGQLQNHAVYNVNGKLVYFRLLSYSYDKLVTDDRYEYSPLNSFVKRRTSLGYSTDLNNSLTMKQIVTYDDRGGLLSMQTVSYSNGKKTMERIMEFAPGTGRIQSITTLTFNADQTNSLRTKTIIVYDKAGALYSYSYFTYTATGSYSRTYIYDVPGGYHLIEEICQGVSCVRKKYICDAAGCRSDDDACPDDPNKTQPGICGCGVPDVDSDGDGVMDCRDACPADAEKSAADPCGCGTGELRLAPPNFTPSDASARAVFVDLRLAEVNLTFDLAQQRLLGEATVMFQSGEAGMPILDLAPEPGEVKLNGIIVPPADYSMVLSPDELAEFRVLHRAVPAKSCNVLSVKYDIPVDPATFGENAARKIFDLSDFSGRFGFNFLVPRFWEQYGPSNLEFDAYQQNVRLVIRPRDAQTPLAPHSVFSNGKVSAVGSSGNEWYVEFPRYFTTSSFYLHVSDSAQFRQVAGTFTRSDGSSFPIRLYSKLDSGVVLEDVLNQTVLPALTGYEAAYGRYGHPELLIHVPNIGRGGMEYAGATMAGLLSLPHELLHMWFARGVMPSDGNANWIDEGLATWHDWGQPAEEPPLEPYCAEAGSAIGDRSPYAEGVTQFAYPAGGNLFTMLNYMMGGDGVRLKEVLARVFAARNHRVLTSQDLQGFVEQHSGVDPSRIQELFSCYVYGKPAAPEEPPLMVAPASGTQTVQAAGDALEPADEAALGKVPLPFSAEELKRLQ